MQRAFAVLALAVATRTVGAQTPTPQLPPMRVNAGGLVFKPVADAPATLTFGVKIGNGTVENPAAWPGTFVARATGLQCTATLIGPSVLLTAAHCVGPGASVSIDFGDGNPANGICDRSPGWTPQTPSVDMALCLMSEPVLRPFVGYESISLEPERVPKNGDLTLAGYGCTDKSDAALKPKPALTSGKTQVDFTPGSLAYWPGWLVTKSFSGDGSAYLCNGDSGGAAYFVYGKLRQVVAIASAFEGRTGHPEYGRSYLTALSAAPAREFLKDWLDDREERVCGFGSFKHPRCRSLAP